MFRSDPSATARRVQLLTSYLDQHVLSPARCGEGRFICASEAACRASLSRGVEFLPGQLSYVGRHYDLFEDGRPLRLVVVGQEQGHRPALVTLDARSAMVAESGLLHRYRTDGNYPTRNPHMRGTTSALRVLFGGSPGDDHDGEFLTLDSGERVHIFDAFALVNVLLCSAVTGRRTGHASRTMRQNCTRHLAATLRALEPTIVVLQGVAVAEWTRELFAVRRRVTEHLAEAEFDGRRTWVCSFSHPSERTDLRWGDRIDAPYLRDIVVPTLGIARRRVGI